jgi:thiamine-monophosphate kinase
LAGGDYSSSPLLMISITVIGRAQHPVYRHQAKAGDLVGITGVTGESALGLKLLLQGEHHGYFAKKHKEVYPELIKGPVLSRYVNAMIDVSDGLLMDLNRILTASAKGARIYYEKIPVTPELHVLCREKGWDEYEALLAGGEDYVLLFTISPAREHELKKEGIQYTIIGEITDCSGELVVEERGKPIILPRLGYDHFGSDGTHGPN